MDLSCHISQRGHLERTSGYVREIPNGTERSQSLGLYDVIIESEVRVMTGQAGRWARICLLREAISDQF